MFDEQNEREPKLAAELVAIEQQLRGLAPKAARIDRDRLMFEAGRVAERAGNGQQGARSRLLAATQRVAGPWYWPAATATMTAAAILLATMLVWQNQSELVAQLPAKPQAAGRAVSNPDTADMHESEQFVARNAWSSISPATGGYLGVRYIALTRGIDALPMEIPSAGGDREMPSDNHRMKPATARSLLDELLPASARTNQSRS